MIDLYTASTFNGQRVSIMLEETGLDYSPHRVDLAKGEQHQPDFVKLNPSARIPVIVDHETVDNKPFILSQSIAILQYLAEKTGKYLPQSLQDKARVYEWMHFHAVDIGSNLFSAFYLEQRCSPRQSEAADLLRARIHELYKYFDRQLNEHEFVAGQVYSIADIAVLPAALAQESKLTEYRHLMRWLQEIKQRPAVMRGMSVPRQEN